MDTGVQKGGRESAGHDAVDEEELGREDGLYSYSGWFFFVVVASWLTYAALCVEISQKL